MENFERMVLIEALKKSAGRAEAAAMRLGMARNTFYDRLAKYGLKARDYKT
ncbi:MAG: helix-turn-helix domain-containing protein [Planktomarina sp.]